MIIACIPAFNEEKYIASVVLNTLRYVDKVFVCDDGSTDLTTEIAEEHVKRTRVSGVNNFTASSTFTVPTTFVIIVY